MSQPNTFEEFQEPSLFDVASADIEEAVEQPEEIDIVEVLGDLADIVGDIFTTWLGDGEEKWAAQAYLSLKSQGLVDDTDSLAHTRNGVLLCTVWALSKEFYVRAFDEGEVDDWTYAVPDVIDEFPKLSPVSIGRLAEREGVYSDIEDGDENPYDLLKELVRNYAPAVAGALLADLSDTWILPYMWAIPSADVCYPLPHDHGAWDQLHDPSGNAQDAYSWIADGMPL